MTPAFLNASSYRELNPAKLPEWELMAFVAASVLPGFNAITGFLEDT
jgi:hypothetical protein